MNEFDFKSWYVLLAIFIAHIYRHYSALEAITEAAGKLKDALDGTSNVAGIKKRSKEVWSAVLGFDAITLHLLAILVLTTIVLLLFNIPQNFLDSTKFGPLAYPFNLGEKVVYLVVAVLFFLSYITKAVIPAVKAAGLLIRARSATKRTKQ